MTYIYIHTKSSLLFTMWNNTNIPLIAKKSSFLLSSRRFFHHSHFLYISLSLTLFIFLSLFLFKCYNVSTFWYKNDHKKKIFKVHIGKQTFIIGWRKLIMEQQKKTLMNPTLAEFYWRLFIFKNEIFELSGKVFSKLIINYIKALLKKLNYFFITIWMKENLS